MRDGGISWRSGLWEACRERRRDRPHGGASNLCRYSDEPFNTNEIIWPHWGMVPSHPPTAILAMATFAALGRVAQASH